MGKRDQQPAVTLAYRLVKAPDPLTDDKILMFREDRSEGHKGDSIVRNSRLQGNTFWAVSPWMRPARPSNGVLRVVSCCVQMTKERQMRQRLMDIFDKLLAAFGPRHWWPGDSPLEVMIGAVLTQNTSWRNVEKAIDRLKERSLIDMARIAEIDEGELAQVIRPAGYYNIKAKRLKALITGFYPRFGGAMEKTADVSTADLRAYLLSLNGIGPETADSILLYALERPVFVVDAYTRRFLGNHGLTGHGLDYDGIQRFFMDNLPEDTYLFNEYHALIVRLAQGHCRKKPLCVDCPLAGI